jgi:hypothetical protein
MRGIIRRIAPALIAAAGLAAVAAPALGQGTSVYPTDGEARTFATSSGGWTASSSSAGECAQGLLCPAITNTYQPSGGTGGAGDGFLRTTLGDSIVAAGGESSGVWESPPFTYQGAAGEIPDQVQFALQRKANVAPFLNGAGAEADYTVEIVGGPSAAAVAVPVDHQPIGESATWIPVGPIDVDPSALTIGQDYRIRLTSHFEFAAQVQTSADIDYDDVSLTAVKSAEPQPGMSGTPGTSGTPGSPGAQGPQGQKGKPGKSASLLDVAFLNSFIKNNTRNWIGIRGRTGLVFVRCPGRAKLLSSVCRFELAALVKRSGPQASRTAKLKLKPRGKRTVSLALRQGAKRLAQQKTVLVRYVVKVGNVQAKVFKQLRVVHCERVASC